MSLFLGLFVPEINASEAANPVDPAVQTDVASAVQKAYPDAKVLATSSACKLGQDPKDTFGLLIQLNSKASPPDQDPLRAVVAIEKNGTWTLNDVPRKIEYSRGAAPDFLSEFWSQVGFQGPFEIRCTVLPSADPAISPEANGEFVGAFARGRDAQAKHLCFQASNVYNSWACVGIKPVGLRPEISFIQMNAD